MKQKKKVYKIQIKHLVEENRVNDSLDYFKKSVAERFYLGPCCYVALVTTYQPHRSKRHKEVYHLLNEMRDSHVFPETSTFNATILFLCRGKIVDIAMDPFNENLNIGLSLDNFRYSKLIYELCRIENG
jgi:hypothetical protein